MKLFKNPYYSKPDNIRKYVIKRLSLMLFLLLLLVSAAVLIPLSSTLASTLGISLGKFAKLPPKVNSGIQDKNMPQVLAEFDDLNEATSSPRINFNLVTNFKDNVYVDGDLLVQGKGIFPIGIEAPNVVYSITPGTGIRLSGDSQNVVIESDAVSSFQGETGAIEITGGNGIRVEGLTITSTGVTSFAGQTGDVTLVAGDGIVISGNTISADTDVSADTGSAQNIFKTIAVTGQSNIVASSNTDTLNFAPGTGITLTTDSSTKTLTIASSSILTDSGFTDDGTIVRLTDPTDSVGIGTSAPLSKFSVGTNSEFQVTNAGAIAAATGITSSGTITFSGLAGGGSQLIRVDNNGSIQVIPDGANGAFLGTDGAGNYVWSSPSGAGDITQVGSMTSGAAFSDATANGQWLGLGLAAGRMEFNDLATDTLNILSANVGIGTSTPNYRLEVAGDIKVGNGSLMMLGTDTVDPASAPDGSIYYRTSDNRFRCRENGAWRFCDTSASGSLSGSGTNGQAAFFSSSSTLSGTNNFFWDSANNRLGIGTSTPSVALDVAGNLAVSGSGSFSNLTTSAQSGITLNPFGASAGNTGEARFSELAANGSSYTGFKAPDSLTSNIIYTLPTADGSNNYVLSTNGSGVLSWNSISGVGSITGTGTTNSIPRFTSSSTLGDSGFTDNGSVLGFTRDISFTATSPNIAISNTETLTITDGTNTLFSLADGGTAGNLSGIGNFTAGGTITFSGLSTGIAHIDSSGVVSSSAVNLASGDITGTLGVANGGTGTGTTPTNGQLLIGNGTGYTLATITNGTGVSVTNGSGSITITNTGVTSIAGTTNQVNASAATGAVTLSLPQNIDTAANVNFGTVTTAGQGGLTVNPFGASAGNTGEVRFKELAAGGSNYVGFKAPDSATANTVWTLPSADGSSNYVLTTNGSGTLSWNSISGVGSLTGSGTTNSIPRFTSSNTIGDSGLTDNGSIIGISRDISFTATTPSIAIANAETFSITDGTNTLLSLADGGTAGNLSGIGNLTASGTVTFSGLGTGIAHFSSGGVISSSAVDLASADVTGILGIANGGTGTGTTPTNGQLLIGNGSGYSLAAIANGTGISVTNGAGSITITNTGVTSVTGTANQVNISGSTGAVTFSLPQDINTTANVNFGSITSSTQGGFVANPYGISAGETGESRFQELAANGSGYVGFKAPDSITSSTIWTLPSADGSNNYVLTTNGSGVLTWNSVTGVGSLTGSGTTNSIPRFTSTSTLGDSGLTDNGSLIGITRDISFTASTPSIAITNTETFSITDGTNTLLSLADGGTAGNLSGIGNLTAGGTITFSSLGTGIAHFSSGGVISSSAVNLASADVTGILGISNGGTGTNTTPTNGQLLIGNGTGYSVANITGGTGIGITNGSGSINIANTGVTSVTGTTNQVSVSGSTGAVTFSLPQDIDTGADVIFNSLATNAQGGIVINPYGTSGGNTGETRFQELASNGSEYTGFKAPDSLTSSTIYTLPSSDGGNNYVLSTSGTGILSWIAQSSGLGGSGTTNTIPRFTSSTTLGDSGLTDDGTTIGITRDITFTASTPSIAITNGATLSITDGTNTLLSLADGGTVGNLSGIGNLTASGTVTFSGLTTGIAHFSSGGVISSSAVDLASGDVTGILSVSNGGTGTGTAPTNGQLLIGNGTGYTLATITAGTGIGVTNGSGTITVANTGVTQITGTANQVIASGGTGSVTLSLPQSINTTANVNFGSVTTSGQGGLVINPYNTSAGNTGEARFQELTTNGTNYTGFKSPDNLTSNTIYTLPNGDGGNNYVLTTNGSGTLSWNSLSGTGAITGTGTTNTIPRFTGASSIGDSGITDDGSILGLTRDISFTASTPSIAITDGETITITDGTNTLLSLADAGTAGNLSGIGTLTAGGTVTFSNYGTGIAHFNSSGVLTSSAVNLASGDVTGTLTINKGGTGVSTTPTNGQLLIGNGTGYTLAGISAGTGIGVTNGSGSITIANTGVTSVTGTTNQVNVSGNTGAVTFSLPQNIDTAADVIFGSLTTNGQASVTANPYGTNTGETSEFRFKELVANGSEYVGFKAPNSVTGSVIWTLPAADGSSNYVLTTNGSGALSWNSIGGAGAITGSGTTNTLSRFTGTNTIGDSGITDDGSILGFTRDINFSASTPSIAISNGATLTITDGTNTLLSLADGGTSGNLSGIGNLTAGGTITFSGLGSGIAHFSSGGVISSSAVNLASADVTGILGIANGGTGTSSTPTNGQLLIGNGSGYSLAGLTAGTGIGITNGSGTITIANTGVTSVTGTTNQVNVSGNTGAVTFSLPQDINTGANVIFNSLTTNGQGSVVINPFGSNTGETSEIRFKELAANGSEYVGFKAPDTLTASTIWTLPSSDGSSNYVLKTNGSGVLSWDSIGGAGAITGSGTTNTIPRFTGTSTLGDSGLTDNGSLIGISRDINFTATTPSIAITNAATLTITDGTNTLLSLADGGTAGNLSGINNLTATGTITFSGLGSGIAHFSSGGVISSSAVDLASADITGVLGVANGGTGTSSTPTNGQLLIGNGTGYTLATITAGTGIGVTNGSGTISIVNTGVTSVTGTTNQVNVSGSTGAVTFSLPQDINTSANVSFGSVTTSGQGGLVLNPYNTGAGNTSEIRFNELTTNGTNYVGFKAPDSATANTIWTLPSADGSSNYVLKTNGAGVLSWDSIGGAGALTGSGTLNTVARFTGTNTLGDSGITDNGTLIGITRDISFTASTPSIALTNGETLSITDGTNTLFTLADAGTIGNLGGVNNITFGGIISGAGGNATNPTYTFTGNANTGLFSPGSNILAFGTNSNERARFDSNGYFGLGTTSPATRLDVVGAPLNTDADNAVGIASFTQSITKNDANTRTFYGVNIKPTLNTGASNTNTTYNIFNIESVNTSTTGLTTNLFRAADGSITRFLVQQSGNVVNTATTTAGTAFQMNYNQITTGVGTGLSLNGLTSGNGLAVTSSATGITGNLALISATGDNAAITGNILKVENPGALSAATTLLVTNGGTGTSLRINDDGTDTDTSPFIVDASGNVGIGTVTPLTALDVNGNARLQAQGELRFADSDSSNYVGFKAPGTATANTIWTLPSSDGANNYVLSTNGSGVLTWSSVSGVGSLTGSGTTNFISKFSGTSSITDSLLYDNGTNVGIGTSSPSTKLDVAGSIFARAQGEVRFGDSDSSNYVGFRAPSVVTSNAIWTLPASDGANNYVLSTNGSGVLTWSSVSGVGSLTGSGTTNSIARFTGTNSIGDSGVTDDGSVIGFTRDLVLSASTPSLAITDGETLSITDGTNTLLSLVDNGTTATLGINSINASGTYAFNGTAANAIQLNAYGASAGNTSEVRFQELSGNGTNYTGFKAPDNMTANTIYTLPAADGGSNYVLSTSGAGVLSWVAQTGGISGSGTTNTIPRFTSSTAIGDSGLTDNGSVIGITRDISFTASTPSIAITNTETFSITDGTNTLLSLADGGTSGNLSGIGNLTAGGTITFSGLGSGIAHLSSGGVLSSSAVDLASSDVTGVLGIANGGTGTSSTPTSGQLLIGNASNGYTLATLSAGAGIGITNGSGSINIVNTGVTSVTGTTNQVNVSGSTGSVTFSLPQNINTSANVNFGSLTTSGQGGLVLNPFGTGTGETGEIRFKELAANGSNYTGFKSPDNLTASTVYTLPAADGTNDYVLTTDGAGGLNWESVAGIGAVNGSGTINTIPRFTGTGTLGDSGLTDNGTLIGITRDISFTATTPSIAITNAGTLTITDGTNTLLSLADAGTAGNLSGIANLTATGTITFSGLGSGIAHLSSGGVLSSSAVDLASADVTGTLAIGNGGTGTASTPTNGQLLIGNGTDYTLAAITAGTGIGVTNGSGSITIANTGVTSVTGTTNQVNVSGSTGAVTFSLPQSINTTANVNFGSVTTSGQAALTANPFGSSAGNTSEVRFKELAANGSEYVGFKSPDSLTASTIWTLPSADGSNNYVLTTNGSGALSWNSIGGTGGITGSGTTNTIPRFTGTNTIGDSGITDNGTLLGLTRDISFSASTPSIAITNAETLTITDGTNTLLSLADGGTAGNLSGIANLTATGTITFSGLGSGIAHFSSGGVLSSSAVDLASADVTGTLAVGNGGTGTNATPTNGQLLIGNGSGYTLATISGGTGIGVTNGSGTISLVNTGVTSVTGTTNQVNVSGSTGAVTFSLPQSINTTANVNFGSLTTSGQGGLVLNPFGSSAGNTSEVRFKELAANGSNYVGFKSPDNLTATTIWTLPSADGSDNYVLTTDGTGVTTWESVSGIGGLSGSGTTNSLARFTGTTTLGDSGITDNGSILGFTRDISFSASTPSIAITDGETLTITDGSSTLLSLEDAGSEGNLSGIADLTASGTITFSGLTTGIAHFSSGGVISSSAVNLASADVTGTLTINKGGTGTASTPTNGQLLIGNGTTYTLATISAGTGIGVTNGSGSITIANTGVTSVTGTTNQVNVSGSTGAVTFSLPQNIDAAANVSFGSLALNTQGALTLNPYNTSAGNTSEIRFSELAANGSNYVGFKAPDNATANTIWTLPSADGSNNYVLTTNGSGVTSWSSISGAGGLNGSGTTNSLARFTSTSTLGDSGITDDGSILGFTRDINFSATTPSIAITNAGTLTITDGTNTLLSLADGGTAGNLSGIANLTASGTVTFSGLGAGIARFSSGGVISSSAVDLASADVTGTLAIGNGGTGVATTPTNGQLLIGNGTGYTLAAITGGTGIGVTNGSGTINLVNTGVTSVTGTTNQVNVSGSTGAVTFSLPQSINTTANVNFGSLTTSGQGGLVLNPFNTSAGNTGEIRFSELAANGSGYVGFKAPDSITTNTIWTLPSADGSNNYVLTTNGSGVTSWASVSGVGGLSGSGTTNSIARFTGTSSLGDSGLTDDGSIIGITRDISFTASTPSIAITNAETLTITDGTNTLLSLADGGTAGNLSGIGTLTAGGTVTFSNYGTGIAHFSSGGVISSSAVNLASADVTGTLGVTNGGTGTATSFTTGSVVFAGASGVYTQDNNNFFFDDTNNYFGLGTSTPATRLDVNGLALNTDADGTVGAARFINSVTKNDSNTRTLYGVNINPTINTGGSNTNTTFNALNVQTTETSVTGTTLNLLRLASGSTQRFVVTNGGAFTMSTGAVAGNGLNLVANSLTSGNGITVNSTAAALTGNLGLFSSTGNNTNITGNILKVENTGASSAATTLMVSNAGTSNGFRVNDDGTDTDSTPFIIDASGNVAIGAATASNKLDINGDARVLAQGDIRLGDSDSSNYVALQAPTTVGSNYTLTFPNAVAGGSNYALVGDGTGTLSWLDTSSIGGGADITAVGSMTSGAVFADTTADDDWLGLGSTAGRIEFDDQSTDEVNILGANVGIGTSAPTTTLDFLAGGGARIAHVDGMFGDTANNRLVLASYAGPSAVNSSALLFYTANGSASGERARIDSVGNMGLGTSTPTTRLDVAGITLNTDADGTVGASRFTTTITKNDTNTRTFYGTRILPTINAGGSNTNTTFHVLDIDTTNTAVTGVTTNLIKASYGGTTRMSLSSTGAFALNGSVGTISTSSTGNDINFSRNGANYINATDSVGTLNLGARNVQGVLAINGGAANSLQIANGATANTLYVGAGQVGIGNTNPGVALDVTGDIQARAQGDVRFADSDSSNYVALQAPTTVGSNYTLTFPNAVAGGSNYALIGDATGALSWLDTSTIGGGADITAVGSMTSGAVFADNTADDDWLGLGSTAGRIEFDDQTTDEINFVNANVGIGNTAPSYPLHVTGNSYITGNVGMGTATPNAAYGLNLGTSPNDTTGTIIAARIISTAAPASASSASFRGAFIQQESNTAQNITGTLMGLSVNSTKTGAGTDTEHNGFDSTINVNGGTVTTARNLYNIVAGGGSITTGRAIESRIRNTGSGTIGTASNLYIRTPENSGGGTLTTQYGLYMEDLNVAGTSYAILTNAGDIVFNEGGDSATELRVEGDTDTALLFTQASSDRVGIGTSAPGAKLDVAGDIQVRAQGDVRLADSDSSNYVALQSPTTVGSNYTLTFPNAVAGGSNYALVGNTSGDLSWLDTSTFGTGDITAVGSMTSGAAFADTTADDDWLGLGSTAGRIEFDDQATDEVNILSARLGVGTTAPSTSLSVLGTHVSGTGIAEFKGSGQYGYVTLDTTTSGSSALSGFIFKNGGTKIGEISSDNSSMFIFNNLFGGGAEPVITATSTGRVGIGAGAGADTKLHVIDTAEQMRLGYDAANYTSFTTDSAGDLTVGPSGGDTTITGTLTATSNLTVNAQGDVRLADSDSSNYVALQAPTTVGSNYTLTFPNAVAGGSNYALVGNTSGDLSWLDTSTFGTGDITAVGSMTSGAAFADTTADDDWLGLGSTAGRVEFDDQSTDEVNILGARLGVGTSTPGALTDFLATTEQLRLSYDGSNRASFTVSSGGDLTIAPTGSDTNLTGNLDVSGNAAIGSTASVSTSSLLSLGTNFTPTSGQLSGVDVSLSLLPSGSSSAEYYGGNFYVSSGGNNITGTVHGVQGYYNNESTGSMLMGIGVRGRVENSGGGSLNTAYGIYGRVHNGSNSTISLGSGLYIDSVFNSGTVTNNYGINVAAQTGGTSDYGIRVDAADTQTLWLSGNANNTTAAAGIAFGSSRDTNLYRSAAGTLATDGNFILNAQGDIRFADSDSSNYVGFQAPTTVTSNLVWTLPSSDGSNGYALTTNGSGTLSWTLAGGDITAVGSMTSGDVFSDTTADDDWLGLGAAAGRIEFDDQATDEINLLGANVGIGTTAPSSRLTLNQTATTTLTNITQGLTSNGINIETTYDAGTNYFPGIMWSTSDNNPTRPKFGIYGLADGTGSTMVLGTSSGYATGLTNQGLAIDPSGNIGLGTLTPGARLDVNGNALVQGNATVTGNFIANAQGDLRLSDSDSSNYVGFQAPTTVTANTIWTLPSADGAANQVLQTNGSGTLTWADGGDITAVGSMTNGAAFADTTADDDWLGLGSTAGRIEFDDQATDEINFLGANVGIGTSTPTANLDLVSSNTTTNIFAMTANSLTTGYAQSITSNSTGLTSGRLFNLEWNPSTTTTATGDLARLSINGSANIGNFLNIVDDTTSLFSVSESAFTTSLPTSFTAPGDLSVSYDLAFTNQTSSYIRSNAPLTLDVGETWESNDLSLITYNSGRIVAQTGTGGMDLSTSSSGTQLRFGSSQLDEGGYLISTSASQAILSAGASYNGSNWIAKSTSASAISQSAGSLVFYGDTSLTTGNSFTPTARWTFGPTGSSNATATSTTTTAFDFVANSVNSGTGLSLSTNALSSGSGMSITSNATSVTGRLLNVTASGSNAASTGQVARISATGANFAGPVLMLSNAGTGLGLRVNDDGTDTDTTPVVVTAAGNFGVGLAAPSWLTSISGSQASSSIATIVNTNTANNTTTNVLRLGVGSNSTNTNPRFVIFYAGATSDSNGTAVGHINLNNNAVNYATTGADYGEYFDINEPADFGDMVAINANGVGKADSTSTQLLGVISDTTGFTGNTPEPGSGASENMKPVGLMGQVGTKVDTSNGPIKKGDFITVSSVNRGVGAKATNAGYAVGQAMEDFNGPGIKRIRVMVASTYADPRNVNNRLALDDNGFVKTDKFKANEIQIGPDGVDLMTTINNQLSALDSQATSLNNLSTDFSSIQAQTDQRLAQIEHDVATMSASLAQVESADVTKVASIEANLAILEQRTTTLEDTVASLSAKLNDLVLNGSAATDSGILATSSATLDDLTVTNNANVNNLGVTGTISAGNMMIEGLDALSESSINTLGGTLKIQSLAVNDIEFEAGKIKMDTQGNMTVEGSLTTGKVKINTSDTLGASAGKDTIPAGQTSIVVDTTAVKPESLIFVTATSKTGQVLSVSNQVAGTSFTVNIPAASAQNINFNWWIVDAVSP